MNNDLFERQIESVERLADQVNAKLAATSRQTADWSERQQQIQNHVQPVRNKLLQTVQHKMQELLKFKPSRHPQLLEPSYNRLVAFPYKAPRHSQAIIFRICILGLNIQYWFRRLLPFLIALILFILLIIYWEEVVTLINDLPATTSLPSQ